MYALMLFLGTLVAGLMLLPGIQQTLADDQWFCPQLQKGVDFDCSRATGFQAVYRICFSLAMFFFLLMVFMFGVKSSHDFRAKIQNGFWFFKYLFLAVLLVGAFYIRTDRFATLLWLGLLGGFLFILIQLVLIIDFAHGLAESWIGKYEESESRGCYFGMLTFTFTCYGLALFFAVLMYLFYAGPTCTLNKLFISFNLLLCLVVSIVSVIPVVQEHMPSSGILQSSLITLYVMYLTWAAMMNNPDKSCNPSLLHVFGSNDTLSSSSKVSYTGTNLPAESIVSLVLWFLCLLYASIRSSSNTSLGKITGVQHEEDQAGTDGDKEIACIFLQLVMLKMDSMDRYVGPVNPSIYPLLTLVLLVIGLFFMAWFFVYEVTSNKYTRNLLKELLVSAVAAVFMGFGIVFLMLWVGIYV